MNVAIAGFGQEGKASYAYWNTPDNDITIVDERTVLDDVPEGVKTQLGPNAFSQLESFDIVIRSAGVAPHKLQTAKKIWSATNEFFQQCPAPIIGVTGTKGKGTTSSLITSILQTAGKTVHLVGNIGIPALDELSKIIASDIVVYELSSFQLWDIEKSPQVAVVLKVEPDHLQVHADMSDYTSAKANIRRFQKDGDVCFYHPTDPVSASIANLQAGGQRYGATGGDGAYTRDGSFWIDDVELCATSVLQIPGEHNIENACAAISAAWAFTHDKLSVETGLHAFLGLPHRIKLVKEVDGVRYIDDSYSAAPGAAIAAINSFEAPKIIILGGSEKKADYTDLAQSIAETSSVKKALLIGQTKRIIEAVLIDAGVDSDRFEVMETTDFVQIVSHARALAIPGDMVILSPACASFDMFKNFTDRGEQFIRIVGEFA